MCIEQAKEELKKSGLKDPMGMGPCGLLAFLRPLALAMVYSRSGRHRRSIVRKLRPLRCQ